MQLLTTTGWDEYELLDSGEGYRLERFGRYTIAKPDPQAIWKKSLSSTEWQKADATFERDTWVRKNDIPERWTVNYHGLKFYAKLTPFKHTGIFPEQHLHWDFIQKSIKNHQSDTSVLNLFAYTGIASLAAASAGATVTHVDASRPAITWAHENQEVAGLSAKPIRWILDDVVRFVEKEVRRGRKYDGIIMDPPIYGHGPNGEVWDFAKSFPKLIELCSRLLSDKPLFVIVNAYAISASSLMLENVLRDYLNKGNIEVGELVLKGQSAQRLLSTGIYAKWSEK
jgi:23S rRNA (cytosine1962-C5)-methyltransferase